MSKPMTDEERRMRPLESALDVLGDELRGARKEIDRLNGDLRNEARVKGNRIIVLQGEKDDLLKENRKARELLDFAAGLLEVEYEDDGVAEWQVAYRAFLDGEES